MIIPVPQTDESSIDTMQRLLDILPVNHPKRTQIESDLHKMLSGRSGEKTIAYQLEFWFRDAEDVVVANNLRLEFNGRSAQIDHVVAVPAGLMVMESKAMPYRVHVDEDGNWFQIQVNKGTGPQLEGMFNPVEQNKRHISVIHDILAACNGLPIPKLANVIVLPSPKIVLTGTKPPGVSIVRVDGLKNLIDRARARNAHSPIASPREWIDALLVHHRPIAIDVFRRYHIDPRETRPLNERIVVDEDTDDFVCAFCGTPMSIRKTKNGLVWSCNKYPVCKNIVPATVAAQVAQQFVDDFNRNHFWRSKAQRCPNCGGKMQYKRNRYGEYRECVNTLCRFKA